MPPPLPPPDEEDYDSAADSDFDASISPSSGDESEAENAGNNTQQKGKKPSKDVEMGSGDEGIVAQGRKKKRRKGKGKGKGEDKEDGDEEEGPVGVRVRLRSGRGGEESKKSTLPKPSGATIDIDSVWARLNNPKPLTLPSKPADTSSDAENIPPSSESAPSKDLPSILKPASSEQQTITIPHTYVFAGETHTSTKTVPTSSPEAQAYLASKDKPSAPPTGPPLRRPLARKGLLDPNPNYLIRGRELPPRADLPTSIGGKGTRHLDTSKKATQWDIGKDRKAAKKLNTVEKSKLDWEAEVERQGMREELERAEKSGGSYLGRREFLERVEGKGEEEARLLRLKLAGVAG